MVMGLVVAFVAVKGEAATLVGTLTLGIGTEHVAFQNGGPQQPLWMPFGIDARLITSYGFGLAAGDTLFFSMNIFNDNEDANHPYFGFGYWREWGKVLGGASLLCWPVYLTDSNGIRDELISGRIDITYFLTKELGATLQLLFGGTSGWAFDHSLLFTTSLGLSIRY
jgi:hypothetical protein